MLDANDEDDIGGYTTTMTNDKVDATIPFMLLKHKCTLQGRFVITDRDQWLRFIACDRKPGIASKFGPVICICIFIAKGMVNLNLVIMKWRRRLINDHMGQAGA